MLADKGFTGAMRGLMADGENVVPAIMNVFLKYTKTPLETFLKAFF
jgi:hypothetical protein